MLTLTTTGSTARRSVMNGRRRRSSGGAADGEPVLAAVHGLRAQRRLTALGTAQLAQHAPAVIDVHALADERRAMAAVAVVAAGRERHHAPPQQLPFELGSVMQRLIHDFTVRRPTVRSSCTHEARRKAVRARTGIRVSA